MEEHNKLIELCGNCKQDYCQECTKHEHWENYCSEACYNEFEPPTN